MSAATSNDPSSGETYYLADIGVAQVELAKLGDNKLLPRMPVEVLLQRSKERHCRSYRSRLPTNSARPFENSEQIRIFRTETRCASCERVIQGCFRDILGMTVCRRTGRLRNSKAATHSRQGEAVSATGKAALHLDRYPDCRLTFGQCAKSG